MAAICLKCCKLPCDALGHCCSGMEKGCSKGCSCLCGLKCCPENHPSPIFLSYTILFNVPILVAAVIVAVIAFGDGCDDDMWVNPAVWNLVAAGCAFFFIIFSIRVYTTLSKPYHQDPASGMEAGTSQQQPQSVSKSFRERVWYTSCHDPLTFIYMFMYPFALAWSIGGLSTDEPPEECDDTVDGGIRGIAAALLVYLLCTVFVAMISCCWEVSRLGKARYEGRTDQSSIPPAQLATHMFVPSFSGKPGFPVVAPPHAQQAPQGQYMQAPDAVPVGTAAHAYSAPQAPAAQQAPPQGMIEKMQHAFHR